MKHITSEDELISRIKSALGPFRAGVKRHAQSALKYDYLVPSGYYEEQWDWDGFFIGMALANDISSEAIYLRNWVLNYLSIIDKNGYIPGCVKPSGPETGHRAFLMKPFLAQGAYFASRHLQDFSWIKPHYSKLRKAVLYREKNVWDKEFDLGMWNNGVESGADNNVAILDFPKKSVIASDVNTLIYREYLAIGKIAGSLNKQKDSLFFSRRAKQIKSNIRKHLWNKEDNSYYNLDRRTKKHIKRISYNTFLPLWGEIASKEQAKAYINNYILNPDKLWSKYGIRTLAKDDPKYSNKNMIKPHSNWQGPVWPIANYLVMLGLMNYGFNKEAVRVAQRVSTVIADDIKRTGGMHENYNAETGKGIAAPNFISWNLLYYNALNEVAENRNPFKIK